MAVESEGNPGEEKENREEKRNGVRFLEEELERCEKGLRVLELRKRRRRVHGYRELIGECCSSSVRHV